jgi:hypothetical protein
LIVLELVLGAYALTEILGLFDRPLLAVAATVAIQFLYHLWHPVDLIGLAAFAIFYWRTRRATPLLLGALGTGLWYLLHQGGAG